MVCSAGRFALGLALCCFVLVFFGPFGVANASLGEGMGLVLVLFERLFDLRLFGFVCFLFFFMSGMGCDLWLWRSLGFLLPFFIICISNIGYLVIHKTCLSSVGDNASSQSGCLLLLLSMAASIGFDKEQSRIYFVFALITMRLAPLYF